MSRSELKRLHLIKQAVAGELKQVDIAEVLRIGVRQVGRLVKRVKEFGDEGIIHGLRGRKSNRRYSEEFKKDILDLYHKKYEGFGPLFAIEKLIGKESRKLSDETLRKWLKGEGELDWERKSRAHRKRRERKEHSGEMVQMDGSHHDWLEGRGPWLVLMGYIDDATGKVYGRFYDYEGTRPAMDSFRRYIRKYGIPNSLYADKHTTYQSWEKLSDEDELEGRKKADTQFGRAVKVLKVTLIPANSPQAKGRVERLWKTLQDRLVKDMRLAGIKTKDEANKFLDDGYWDKFNDQFGVVAKSGANLHRRLEKGVNLDRIFCIKKRHTLRNDFTVIHEKNVYQVYDRVRTKSVDVEESLGGSVRIYLGDRRLKSKQLDKLPEKQTAVVKKPKAVICTRAGKQWIPPKDHPWRSFNVSRIRVAA
jgi:transposase-like protein